MKRLLLNLLSGAALALSSTPAARAVVTDKVDHDTFAAFSDGEFDNVSLTSDGHLELAPAIESLAEATDPIIWAAVQDIQGNVFFGTGNQGKIYRLTPKGELSPFFAPNEVMVHALAIDGGGRLYAATSPNGRVYRLDATGHAEVFCNPGETYIWAMAFGKDGSLYLATGNHGKILRVAATDSTPAKVETYFETKEANITALALDRDGSLLAGTNPHGYLYRIDRAGHGFVVFNSNRNEIKQVAVAPDGTIYASTFVESSKGDSSSAAGSTSASGSSADGDGNSGGGASPSSRGNSRPRANHAAPADDASASMPPFVVRSSDSDDGSGSDGPSQGAVYRVGPTGLFTRYWSAPEDESIYSMMLLRDGSLLVGTGEKGRIYSVADATHWKLLQKTSDGAQVSALLPDTAASKQCLPPRAIPQNSTGSIFRWRRAAPTRPRPLTRSSGACGAGCILPARLPPGRRSSSPHARATRRSPRQPGATGPNRSRWSPRSPPRALRRDTCSIACNSSAAPPRRARRRNCAESRFITRMRTARPSFRG